MKKYFLLFALAICFLFTACSDTNETNSISPDTETPSTETSQVESTPIETESTQQAEEISFNEMTVVDNEECAITITGIDPDSLFGYSLKVTLENKSSETTYMFSAISGAVDGLECDPYFASEVAAGKKSVDSIYFTDSSLSENNIKFTDIELTFHVYDSNDWTADYVAEETVHIYPYGEENAEKFERTSQSSDNVILDNEYVKVTVIGYEEDDIWGYSVNVFLENKSDTEVMFSVDEASVNGFMADPFWASSILPGKCAFSSITWYNTTLEENGITGDIEEIEFVLKAYDYENWLADYLAEETIILNP